MSYLRKPFFKLICGASLLDPLEIERLSALYAAAGADLVDVAAHPEAVRAAIRGIGDHPTLVMVSVGVEDDPHLFQVVKDETACRQCGFCLSVCSHGAWENPERCCGCGKCLGCGALFLERKTWAVDLDACWEAGARGLELHTGSGQGFEAFRTLSQDWVAHGGIFSVSVNGRQLSEEEAVRVTGEVQGWFSAPILVQTDGNPISGEAGVESTLPALSLAQALLTAGHPYVQPAGGANDQTAHLAQQRALPIAGVGMGSFARRVRTLPEVLMVAEARRLVGSVRLLDGFFAQKGAQEEAHAQ